jgi:RHS repeat-associated protein
VIISPSGGTYTVSSVAVTVSVYDDSRLNTGSVTVTGGSLPSRTYSSDNSSGTLTGTATLSPGTNTFIVSIADADGLVGADTATYTYTPPPPPPSQDSATLSLAAYSTSSRSLAGCSGCLYGAASYATPAYVSRDMPRSVSLLYSNAQAQPRGLVQVDATVNTTTTPTAISLQLMQGGTSATLTNGGTAAWYTGAIGTFRLAAQLDASSLATGVYDYTAVVTTWWGSTSYQSQLPVRILVINAQSSPEGAGWTIAGLERLVSAGGDSVAIADGSGHITYFARTGTTTFGHTNGDFTTLTVSGGVYTRTSTDGSFARFNSAGLLTAVGTRFGDSTVYAYDGANRIATITDEAGKATTFTYAPSGTCPAGSTSGTLCAITTPGGRVSKFVVNSSNDLVQIIDPDGVTAFTGSYTNHALMSSTDRLAATTSLTYDSFTGLASVTAPAVTTTTTGGSTTSESPVTTYRSIEAALLATNNNSSASAITALVPDSAFAKIIAPNGTQVRMVLQGIGEPTVVKTIPVAGSTQSVTTAYNSDFLPTSVSASPVGGTTTYNWNGDELSETVDANGTRTAINYGASYEQPTVVWVNDVVQQRSYYSGTLATLDSTVAGKLKTTYTWDTHGRATRVADTHSISTWTYESTGFQNTSQRSTGGTGLVKYTHDQYGRDSTITDPLNNVTTDLYDVLNQPTRTTQPGSAVTTASLTENTTSHSTTATLTDPRSLIFTTYANAVQWPDSVKDPQSHVSKSGYDHNGQVRRYVNRLGGIVTANYDSLGRITSQTASGNTITFGYDASVSPADPHWAVGVSSDSRDSVTTDNQGRPVSIRTTRGSQTYTSTMTYDAFGNRKQLTVTNGTWTDSLQFEVDSLMYPFELPDFSGNWTVVRYGADQQVDTLRFPTGSSTTHLKIHPSSYSGFQRPESLTVYIGSSIQQQWSYGYDAAGRLTKVDNGSDKDYVERLYTFDARSRLASYSDHHHYADSTQECPNHEIFCDDPIWTYTWTDDAIRSGTYSPDNSGNRTDHSAVLSNDRLTSMVGPDGRSYSFTYDDEGRRLSKTASGYSQTYGWNDLGQLIWVKTNGDSIAYAYDAAGRRVQKIRAGVKTEYLWDGDRLLMELDSLGNRIREYSYQPGIDQPVAVKTSTGTFYYQLDASGSVGAIWNTSNSTVAGYTYDPYGYAVDTSGTTLAQPLRWKGREYEGETGLYYMRARYYDPSVGRFISEDPAGLQGGINPYAFADGDPVNKSDPTGLTPCDKFVEVTYTDDQGKEHSYLQEVVCVSENPTWPGLSIAAFLNELQLAVKVRDGAQVVGDPDFPRPVAAEVPWFIGGPGGAAAEVDVAALKLTSTVAKALESRPYLNSTLIVQEILRAVEGTPDPMGVSGAFRWDAPGAFNGSEGVWQLVIDTKTQTILHFLFTSKPW